MYHALDVSEEVLVRELKEELAKVEDIFPELQVIRFAGRELLDNTPIGEYTILEYSLQEEVLLYLERKTKNPTTIFIKWPANATNLVAERVSESTTVEQVMEIMVGLQVVAAWAEGADVVVKRASGSTIQNLGISKSHTLRDVYDIIGDAQGIGVERIVFMEGFDGHLHIQASPSQEPQDVLDGKTMLYTLDSNQPPMPKKETVPGREFRSLTRDFCLMDRSTDYEPYHTWLPPSWRRSNPWPTSGPAKPLP